MIQSLSKCLPLLPFLLAGTTIGAAPPAGAQIPQKRVPRSAAQKKSSDIVARKGRETEVIDGTWKFRTDPQNSGEQEGWAKAFPDGAGEITVPSLWTTQSAPGYSGVAWYWREFEPSVKWKKQTVRLRFEAVSEKAMVWLNGTKLGEHEGGATPFEFNITKQVRFGEKNLLAVRVEGEAKRGAGILQGVLLMAHDEAYMSEVSLTAGGLGQIATAVTLENTSDNSGVAILDGRVILVSKPDKDVHRSEQSLSLTPGRNITTLFTSVKGKLLHQWSPDTPVLYALQLAFRQGLDVLDTQATTFGFREFGWKNDVITLNGLPFKPVSVEPSFALPVVVASTGDADRARASFQRLKSAGVSVLYLDAPHPELLRIADEVGMLVVESPRSALAPRAAFDELQALVLRDRSHPCIFAWRLREANVVQISLVGAADPSRFVLIGTSGATKLFPPGQTAGASASPPPGLLPSP